MIIRIIAENDDERSRIQEIEHVGVKEFFIFGNKHDNNKDLNNKDFIDFHDWRGSYRYLEGSLYYFLNVIGEERRNKDFKEIQLQPKSQKQPSFIKRGTIEDPNVNIINVENIPEEVEGTDDGKTIPFSSKGANDVEE